MYRITVKTKHNTIVLEREDYNTPEVNEILNQPYVEEVHIEDIEKVKKLGRYKENEKK